MHKVTEKIATAIRGTEFAGNTYVAGGYIRDLVMGNEKTDLDIAVSLPQGGIKLAVFLYEKNIASKPVIFEQFGTALVEIAGHKIEFVMTRNESYRKGNRKPKTSPGTLQEDIIRRDFTINSLVMDIMTGDIYDLTGKGLDDIRAGVIRATSEPDMIFHDDPLRILRAIRFANRFNFSLEEETALAMKKDNYELQTISWERKRDEFEKILLSNTPARGIRLLYEYGLIKYLVPEIEDKADLLYYEVINALPQVLILRLAAVLQILAEEQEPELAISKIAERLRISERISNKIRFLVTNAQQIRQSRKSASCEIKLRRLVYFHSEQMDDLLEYYRVFCKFGDCIHSYNELKHQIDLIESELKGKNYPLQGNIIKEVFNLPDCKAIGIIKNKGLDIWLKNPQLSIEELISALKQDQEFFQRS